MQSGDGRTVQGGVKLAPFAGRHHRAGRQPHGSQQAVDGDRVGREDLAHQGDGRQLGLAALGRGDRPRLDLGAGVVQHGAGQHVLGLGMGRHAEARHVDADDPHAVDLLGQHLQRHAGSSRHAEVRHHHRVVALRVGDLLDRLADVLVELARNQRFGIEGHVPDPTDRRAP